MTDVLLDHKDVVERASAGTRVEENVAHKRTRGRLRQPSCLRRFEADLVVPIEDDVRYEPPHRLTQHVLRHAAAVEKLGWQRARKLGDPAIEEREAYLATVGH